MPEGATVRVLAASREDMPLQTRLATARHYVENLLATFNLAVSSGDGGALANLTQTLLLELDNGEGRLRVGPGEVLNLLALAPGKSIQTISNLCLTAEKSIVHYTATYQVWTAEGASLSCAAFGHLHGSLVAGPQAWRWVNHCICPLPRPYPNRA